MSADQLTNENMTTRIQLPRHVLALLNVGSPLLVSTIDRVNGRVTVQIPVGQHPRNRDIFYTFAARDDEHVTCHWVSESKRSSGRFDVKPGSSQEDVMGELEFQTKAATQNAPALQ